MDRHLSSRRRALCRALAILGALGAAGAAQAEPWASTYQSPAAEAVVLRGATILDGAGARLDEADLLLRDGRIVALGKQLEAGGAREIDARGRWITPGLIDVHSHLGVYPSPSLVAHQDGNEMIDPVTAGVWAEHAVWPQDPGLQTALEGGVTTLQVLPGSGNLIGGRGVVLRNVPATTYQAMKFPGAKQGLKMACGENPKRVYGSKGQAPMTRMGNVAGYRQAFADAVAYRQQWDAYRSAQAEYDKAKKKSGASPQPPKRDLRLDTLVAAMAGEVNVHIHCYRSDEMAVMLDLAEEYGFRIAAFHHGVEAYKLAGRLAKAGVCGALWADWWSFKLEAYDGIWENLALVDRPDGGCAIVHSDSSEGIQRLNQEAAKAMAHAERAGLSEPPEHAIRWLTLNPARALGIVEQVGSLAAGKRADVVLWNRSPFSVYARADLVFIDGAVAYDRAHPDATPRSDFLLGQPIAEVSP